MNTRFFVKLFVTAATKDSAEAQLERILKELPEGYKHYVYDVAARLDDEVAALYKVTVTPCLFLDDVNGELAQRSLVGSVDDDQVREFLLRLD